MADHEQKAESALIRSGFGARMPALVLWGVLLAASACSTKPGVVRPAAPYSNGGDRAVFVFSHGKHTGLVVPVADILEYLPALSRHFGDADYMELGWGDRAFYQASEVTSGLAIRAVFWPTDSVIHAVAVNSRARSYFPAGEAKRLCLNETELASLLEFIAGSFAKGPEGGLIDRGRGIYGQSRFYDAVGDYYLTNTCNTWTAKGLKSVGMDISTIFQITTDGVMGYLDDTYPGPGQCDQ